jgi:hypothetical protein
MTPGRAKALTLKEAYRPIPVRVGDNVTMMPALQAVLRGQVVLAVKGNARVQRFLVEMVQSIEDEQAARKVVSTASEASMRAITNRDRAKALLEVIRKARNEVEDQE